MIPWIIQMSILSLVLIILVHYLFTFFKTNLTIPKVKDLVNKPQKQYEKLFDTMNQNNIKTEINTVTHTHTTDTMKNELKNYLKDLGKKKNETKTPNNVNNMDGIMTLDAMGSSAYSSF